MPHELRAFGRYLGGLRLFLRGTSTPEGCRRRLAEQLERREDSFLRLLELGVFGNASSPYRRLFEHAGIELGDAVRLVRQRGVEGALEDLYDAGVRVSLDETRGNRPVRRPGLEFAARPEDFDNPLPARHYEARSGRSRSGGTRVAIDLELLTYEASYLSLQTRSFGLEGRPIALWYPVPPGVAGLATALRLTRLGLRAERWFTQTVPGWRGSSLRHAVFTAATVAESRLLGRPLPAPEHTPPEQAERVARWLAEAKSRGMPAFFLCTPSSGVRACNAAREHGLDVSGTFFRFTGEPYTPARAEAVAAAGCRAVCDYMMTELGGHVGVSCAAPEVAGDVHLVTDKLAVLQRKTQTASGASVPTLVFTTLLSLCPKIMINLESDDYGVLTERSCGCAFDEAGFFLHAHTIRSHEKLTSEGMSFLGSELITLVEDVLPARFGGGPTDYQLVEEERDGLPKVTILVGPRVGEIDEAAVVDAVLSFLRARGRPQRMMADVWERASTLGVVRREPYATDASKVLPLHVLGRERG